MGRMDDGEQLAAGQTVKCRRLKDSGRQKPCRPLRTEGGDAKQPPEIGLLTATVRKPEDRFHGRSRGMTVLLPRALDRPWNDGKDFSTALEMTEGFALNG